jgi:hypothetical protein
MGDRDWLWEIPSQQAEKDKRRKQEELQVADISPLTLTELSRRNMALEIYSELLGCTIWLCSNTEMVKEIQKDDPSAICYTVDEVRRFLELKATQGGIGSEETKALLFNPEEHGESGDTGTKFLIKEVWWFLHPTNNQPVYLVRYGDRMHRCFPNCPRYLEVRSFVNDGDRRV